MSGYTADYKHYKVGDVRIGRKGGWWGPSHFIIQRALVGHLSQVGEGNSDNAPSASVSIGTTPSVAFAPSFKHFKHAQGKNKGVYLESARQRLLSMVLMPLHSV